MHPQRDVINEAKNILKSRKKRIGTSSKGNRTKIPSGYTQFSVHGAAPKWAIKYVNDGEETYVGPHTKVAEYNKRIEG